MKQPQASFISSLPSILYSAGIPQCKQLRPGACTSMSPTAEKILSFSSWKVPGKKSVLGSILPWLKWPFLWLKYSLKVIFPCSWVEKFCYGVESSSVPTPEQGWGFVFNLRMFWCFWFISRPWLPQVFAIFVVCLCPSCLVSSLKLRQALSSVLHVLAPFFNKKQVSGKIALFIQRRWMTIKYFLSIE